MKQIRLNLHGQPCSLGKRHTVAAAFRATNHGTDVAERSRKTDRAVAPVPFRAPYSRIGNLMAELPYSFIYELSKHACGSQALFDRPSEALSRACNHSDLRKSR